MLRRERAFSSFSRSFTLPENVQEGGITANLDKGVLTVEVPKVGGVDWIHLGRDQVRVRGLRSWLPLVGVCRSTAPLPHRARLTLRAFPTRAAPGRLSRRPSRSPSASRSRPCPTPTARPPRSPSTRSEPRSRTTGNEAGRGWEGRRAQSPGVVFLSVCDLP